MKKFRTRLLILIFALIMIVLLGLGLLLGQLFKSYYLQSFNEHLKKESNILNLYILDNGGLKSIDKNKLLHISKTINQRVTITDPRGLVLYDSGSFANHANVDLKGKINEVIKKNSNQVVHVEEGNQYDLHYYWQPIMSNGKKEGYLFLSARSDELKRAYSQIWWILSISLGTALVIFIYFGIRIASRYTKAIDNATFVATQLSKGNYRVRTPVDRMNEIGILGSSMNILARTLEELVKEQEIQKDRLSVLIENIGAGLILIDSQGYINLINKGYKEIFHVDPSKYLCRLYYEVMEHGEVSKFVEEIFKTEQKLNRQILLPLSIERRYFDVYGVPIISSNNVWKGVLLVFHDITEFKKLEQMRKDFVANVSHELKTPVTSIKGFTETLLDGAMNDQEALNAFLSIIQKESNRLQTLIQDLLDLSKMEQHGFVLNIHEFDLITALKEIITMLEKKASIKRIRLSLETDQENLWIKGDLNRLKQVFINLIGNAIAYTPDKGMVIVSVLEKQDMVQVSIKDNGIGIEKEEVPRIFERFYRVDKARSRNSGGTGLGLAIVKHLIEAHKGSIRVKSEIGKGSEFIIELNKKLSGNN